MEKRINTPTGYKREDAGSLAEYLRTYPMKPHLSPVLLYNGNEKGNQKNIRIDRKQIKKQRSKQTTLFFV